MATIGDRIRKLRIRLGMTQDALAEAASINRVTIAKYESGIINPSSKTLVKLADALHVSGDYLLGVSKSRSSTSSGAVRIPVLGSIPAGVPLEAIEDIEDYEEIDAAMLNGGKEYFALRITGDSMAPNYLDGDIVILRVAEECRSGQDCALLVNAEEGTFKRVKLTESGMMLLPLNADYEPRFFTKAQVASLPVRILGVAIEIRRTV